MPTTSVCAIIETSDFVNYHRQFHHRRATHSNVCWSLRAAGGGRHLSAGHHNEGEHGDEDYDDPEASGRVEPRRVRVGVVRTLWTAVQFVIVAGPRTSRTSSSILLIVSDDASVLPGVCVTDSRKLAHFGARLGRKQMPRSRPVWVDSEASSQLMAEREGFEPS